MARRRFFFISPAGSFVASSAGALTLLGSCNTLPVVTEAILGVVANAGEASAQPTCTATTTVSTLQTNTASEFASGNYGSYNGATIVALAIAAADIALGTLYSGGCSQPTYTLAFPTGYFRIEKYSDGSTTTMDGEYPKGVIDVSNSVPPETSSGTTTYPGTLILQGQGDDESTGTFTVLITDDGKLAVLGSAKSHGVPTSGPSNNVTFSGIHFARAHPTVSQGTITAITSTDVTLKIDDNYPSPGSTSFYDTTTTDDSDRAIRAYTHVLNSQDQTPDPQLIPSIPYPLSYEGSYTLGLSTYNNDQVFWQGTSVSSPPNCGTIGTSSSLYCTLVFESTPIRDWAPGTLLCIKSKNEDASSYTTTSASPKDAFLFDYGNSITFTRVAWTERSRGVFTGGTNSGKNDQVLDSTIRRRTFTSENKPPCLSTPEGGPQFMGASGTVSNFVATAPGDDALAFFATTATVLTSTMLGGFARGIEISQSFVIGPSETISVVGSSSGSGISSLLLTVPSSNTNTLYNDYLNCGTINMSNNTTFGECPIAPYPYHSG